MTRPRWALAAAATGLLCAVLVLGPSPAPAAAVTGAGPVTAAQLDSGFGSQGEITDRYQIPVWDYRVDGLRARGPDIGQAVNNAPLAVASAIFWLTTFMVVALVWLLRFALDFGVAGTLLGPVEELIGVYDGFVGALGLVPLALMLCVFWFGLAALRGRIGKGAGEITLSFVLATLLGSVLAAPGETLLGERGLLGRSKEIGATVAVLAVQDPAVAVQAEPCRQAPPDGEALVDGCLEPGRPVPDRRDPQVLRWILQTWLVDLYVRQPHQYIVYGERLDCPVTLTVRRSGPEASGDGDPCRPHPCLDQYNQILRTSPADLEGRGNPTADPNSYLYDLMHPDAGGYAHDPACGEHGARLAAYNNSGDWGRVGLALFLLLALILLAGFVVAGVLLPLVVGQVMVAVLAVALVFVLPVALLGGGGRQALWRWFGLLLAALLMIVVALVGLSLMLVTTDLLLRGNWHLSISLLLVCVSSVAFLWLQKRLLKGGMSGGQAAGAALGRIRFGGQVGGGLAPAGGRAAWARAATGGVDPVLHTLTLGQYREDLRERGRYARQLRNQDAVQERNPQYARRTVRRHLDAEDAAHAADQGYAWRAVDRHEEAADRVRAARPDRLDRQVFREQEALAAWHRKRRS